MLDVVVEQLESHLRQHGVIPDALLRSERSLYDDGESREIELVFALADDGNQPVATIHLFPLEDSGLVELEVEITYDQLQGQQRAADRLWHAASAIVREVSYTEKRRYLAPGELAEHQLVLDYHFHLYVPQSPAEAQTLDETLSRFAADLAALLRL